MNSLDNLIDYVVGISFAIFATFVFVVPIVILANALVEIYKKFNPLRKSKHLKKYLGEHYTIYYHNDEEIRIDERANKLSEIIHNGYVDSWFDHYYKRLTESHLPILVLMNWIRTIVEDIEHSISAPAKVEKWNIYFHGDDYNEKTTKDDYIDFDESELAYLWGAVYYWIKCFHAESDNEALLETIENVACQKEYVKPFFYHFKHQFGEISDEEDYHKEKQGFSNGEMSTFVYAVAALTEGRTPVKTSLAPVIAKISGYGESTIGQKLKGRFNDNDKKNVEYVIHDVMPKLAEKVLKL